MVEDLFEYAKKDVEAARDAWLKYFTINPSNKPAALSTITATLLFHFLILHI